MGGLWVASMKSWRCRSGHEPFHVSVGRHHYMQASFVVERKPGESCPRSSSGVSISCSTGLRHPNRHDENRESIECLTFLCRLHYEVSGVCGCDTLCTKAAFWLLAEESNDISFLCTGRLECSTSFICCTPGQRAPIPATQVSRLQCLGGSELLDSLPRLPFKSGFARFADQATNCLSDISESASWEETHRMLDKIPTKFETIRHLPIRAETSPFSGRYTRAHL